MKRYNKTIAILGIIFIFFFLATSAITQSIFITFYWTFFALISIALLLSLIINKNLISRIESLKNGIQEIDLKADINSRLDLSGEDKLSELANNINSMLDSLQEKNTIFQSTVDSVAHGFIAIDNNKQVIFMNPEYRKMYGLPPEAEFENDANKLRDMFLQQIHNSEENTTKFTQILDRMETSKKTNTNAFKLKDGRTILTYSVPLKINNEIYGRLFTHDDITELLTREEELQREISRREKTEQKLILSEEKFSKIATSANDAVILGDNQGEIIFWNNTATKIFGYSENEVLGKKLHDLILPEKYIEAYKFGFERFIMTGSRPVIGKTIEMEGKRKDGTEFPIELSISAIKLSDGTLNSAANIRDITERKEINEMEQELLERLTMIINNINSGIILIDRKNKIITDVNPTAAQMIGLPREEIIGNACHKFVCAADKDMSPIINHNHIVEKSETVLLDKDGKEITVIKSVVGVKLKGKEYLVESFYDISNMKKVEEALINAKIAAEASNMAKSDFLANMSHELRTPLNAIIGFSDILIQNEQDSFTERQTRFLANISNSGKHLLDIINDILDLSKIEAGQMNLELEEFSIGKVFDEVNKTFSSIIMSKNLNLEFSIESDISEINADRVKFKQILYNIVGNAIKFTPSGGTIQVSSKRVLNNIEIEVKDSGIGIQPEDLINLFEPFKQVDSALNRKYEGTGLGLAIVKKYVEMHKGKIHVESEPQKGSSFIYELPLYQ